MGDKASLAQAKAAADFEEKKKARVKAKAALADNGKQDDPKNAWKKDYHVQEGDMVDVLRMGVKSLKELLISLGCPPEELIDPKTGEDYVERDDIFLRVGAKYITLMHSRQPTMDRDAIFKKIHLLLLDKGVPGPYDAELIRGLITKRSGNLYEAADDYVQFAAWSGEWEQEIREQTYQQYQGEGEPPDTSKFFAQRRDDQRARACHEYWLRTHPPAQLPKTHPTSVKVAVIGEIKVPDHITNGGQTEEQIMRAAAGKGSEDSDSDSSDESEGSKQSTRLNQRGARTAAPAGKR